MKITLLQIDNFLGVHSLNLALNTPITLFAGPNGAGKSSVRDAVVMAMSGGTSRVKLKKEFDQLVAEGSKAGGALVGIGDEAYAFNVPAGKFDKGDALPSGEAVNVALNGQRFASMTEDERRTFLFAVTGCRPNKENVQARMVARGCDMAKAEQAMTMLRTGFPDACEFAKKRATESKGAWKAITNKAYGSNVAEAWKADKPLDAPATQFTTADRDQVQANISTLQQQLGGMQQKAGDQQHNIARREALTKTAGDLANRQDNLVRAEKELAEFEPAVVALRQRASGTARMGLVHDLAQALGEFINLPNDIYSAVYKQGIAALDAYTDEHGDLDQPATVDMEARNSLPEHERGLEVLKNRVANLKRDIVDASAAAATLIDLEQSVDFSANYAGDIDKLANDISIAKASLQQINTDLQALDQFNTARDQADAKTQQAAAHHADVVAWLAVTDALAPDGIPGELLAEALAPINNALTAAAIETEWKVAHIAPDMAITAGKRPYALLSESEQWRVDAMIAQAIAEVSGLKILMLDRMDVLDLPGRSALLNWLDFLAQEGKMDTALLFATLKALPAKLPASMAAHWIEGGSMAEYRAAA